MAIAVGLLKTLLDLAATDKSGAVTVDGPGARVRLFVERGAVVFADEGTVGETLGRMLVRERVLTEEQYDAAIEWMTDLRARGKKSKLGEVFVELGLLTPQQVHAALAAQVQQKAVRALAWPTATVVFVECHGALDVIGRFATPIEPLVVAAVRLADRERIDDLLAHTRERYPTVRASAGPCIDACGLRRSEDAFARSLDGTRSMGELVDAAAGGVDSAVVLTTLLLLEALDLDARPARSLAKAAPPRPQPKKTTSAAKWPPAPPSARRPAPQRKPPPLPPAAKSPVKGPRSLRPPPPSMRGQAQGIAARLRAAREVKRSLPPPDLGASTPASTPASARSPAAVALDLATPATPRTPLAPIAPLFAEKAFQLGKRLVRANRIAEAVTELRRAASLYPATEYELWATWAESRANPQEEETLAPLLERIAKVAIEQDSERAFALFVLGHLARRRGDHAKADAFFDRAKSLDPNVIAFRDVRIRRKTPSAIAKSSTPAPEPTPALEATRAPEATPAPEAMPALEAPLAAAAVEVAPSPPLVTASVETSAPASDPVPSTDPSPVHAPPDRDEVIAAEPALSAASEDEVALQREKRRRGARIVAAVVVAIAAGLAMRAAVPKVVAPAVVSETAAASASAPASAAAPASASASMVAAAAASASAAASAVASASAPASAAAIPVASYVAVEASLPPVDAARGTLVLPAAADGHRVYVDGRMTGVPPPPLAVPCGQHVIRIGSQGRDQRVDVPCGGHVSIDYP